MAEDARYRARLSDFLKLNGGHWRCTPPAQTTDHALKTAVAGVDQFVGPTAQPTDYTYDQSGNMIFDYNKGDSITYNPLNKPTLVTFTASSPGSGQKIAYV